MSFSVDIILPTFNRSHVIERAVQSVLNQTYQNYHLLIVDDGSQDDTELVLAPYLTQPNITYLKQPNRGVSAARNLGILSSTSNWIALLDSDDEWLPKKLEIQVRFIQENPSLRFVHSNEIWIRNGIRVNPSQKFNKGHQELFKRSLETCLISPSTSMIRRDLLTEHHYFDETFAICEDYDLWLKILSKEDIGFIDEFLIKKHGGHADQLSTKYHGMDSWRIRSLISLIKSTTLSAEKENLVQEEIKKKAEILLKGYFKHNQQELYQELHKLLSEFSWWNSERSFP